MTDSSSGPPREGSLGAPTRHAIDWRSPAFTDAAALDAELARVFDICHGCRRCFSLCNAFPTLFDTVDATSTGEVGEVPKSAYWPVVEHCYLCDMCYMTKCPYVPPHEWNVDFPHLMLRAKAKAFEDGKATLRDKVLSATDAVGNLAGIPVVAEVVNAVNASPLGRRVVERTLGVDRDSPVPTYHSRTARRRLRDRIGAKAEPQPAGETHGRVVVFATCYGNRNHPGLVEDLVAVLEHNGIGTALMASERCCGMPKLELGDLESVEKLKDVNIALLAPLARAGSAILSPVPSCTLMFKQELPLLFPDDDDVTAVADAMFDPFEYFVLRDKDGLLKKAFTQPLGRVSYHIPCHSRVQNVGQKTREVLEWVPETTVNTVERCAGHDGTWGVKSEFFAASMKIGTPVFNRMAETEPDYISSDCPIAGRRIRQGIDAKGPAGARKEHPLTLLRIAYGLD
jgi:glycerol-3-phosphate dehydrogenase subunit C